MNPRTERPISKRKSKVETRMSKEELAKLDNYCEATQKIRPEIVRADIAKIYDSLLNPETK